MESILFFNDYKLSKIESLKYIKNNNPFNIDKAKEKLAIKKILALIINQL